MTKEDIFEVIKRNIVDIIPEVDEESIEIEHSLKNDIGANSIDRMDILLQSMQDLKVKVPMVKFGEAKNIKDIINVFYTVM